MSATDEQPFEGGNITAVVRVGDTVRRATGPWTPAVHALLRDGHADGIRNDIAYLRANRAALEAQG
jgi:hypothetical protein